MNKVTVPSSLEELLKRPISETDIRITTYIESEMHKELMLLKNAGISIKKIVNVAIGDFLLKHNII